MWTAPQPGHVGESQEISEIHDLLLFADAQQGRDSVEVV